jgi:hypothetical protein
MSPDELPQRFLAEIDKRAADDRYIDGLEERELLQIAIQHGFGPDWARQVLTDACRERGYVVEAAVVRLIRDRLKAAVDAGGRLTRGRFERVVGDALGAVRGTARTDADVRRLVVTTMEDAGLNRIKRGWFGDWYGRLKRELGV